MEKVEREKPERQKKSEPAWRFFDPFEEYFVSQNNRNEFLKSLESKGSDEF